MQLNCNHGEMPAKLHTLLLSWILMDNSAQNGAIIVYLTIS